MSNMSNEEIKPEPIVGVRSFVLRSDPEVMILEVVSAFGTRHYRMARADVRRLGEKLVEDAAPPKRGGRRGSRVSD